MGFPSQHISSVARPFTLPDSYTAPPSSITSSLFTPDDDKLLAEAVSRGETDGKNLSVAMAELSGVMYSMQPARASFQTDSFRLMAMVQLIG